MDILAIAVMISTGFAAPLIFGPGVLSAGAALTVTFPTTRICGSDRHIPYLSLQRLRFLTKLLRLLPVPLDLLIRQPYTIFLRRQRTVQEVYLCAGLLGGRQLFFFV